MPVGTYVERLYFSDNSDALVYWTSDSNRAYAASVPGAQEYIKPSTNSRDLAVMTIKANQPRTLVYLDGQFVGMAPQTFQVPSGMRQIELQRRGYKTQKRTVTVEPNSSYAIDLALEPLPVRKAVESVLRANPKSVAPMPRGKDQIVLRWLVNMPHDEEILGALDMDLERGNAVVFGEAGIYVQNKYSSLSADPQRYFVPYAVFADSPEPQDHNFLEVAITKDVVASLSTESGFHTDYTRKMMTELRKALQTAR